MDVIKLSQKTLMYGAIGAVALIGLYVYNRGIKGAASDVVGGVITGTGQAVWGGLEGAYNATITPFYDAVADELDTVSRNTTGKGLVDQLSSWLYGDKITPYARAYDAWLRGGKRGKRPEPSDF